MRGWVAARHGRRLAALALVLGTLLPLAIAHAAPPPEPGFTPDPATVQRWRTGAHEGWRYPQAGWTVLHIEGPPRERGLQHGQLMAAEIAAYVRALSEYWSPAAPQAAWAQNRRMARQWFQSGFEAEQMQEMQGIADGASAAGARVPEGGRMRRLDVLDIITLNASNEIDTVKDALAVTPHPPGVRVITQQRAPTEVRAPRVRKQRPQRCNAFIANGPATPDGQIVFGHITMYDLYPANFYNVWLEIKPTSGHRFVMQTTPGGMHSGMDYSINEAGLLLAETTLDQGPLTGGGTPLAARVRQAQQYADSIESATALLTRGDNGLCSTEWVMGDLKRNEIALLTLAGGQSRLRRGSRNEWFEGAEGFYWSDNNIKEPGARLAATARRDGRPSAAATFAPSRRDAVWLREYQAHKGRIDLDFARRLLGTPEIVSAYGIDAKYTDARLAAQLQTWATFGPPTGTLWPPTPKEVRDHPAIRPLIPNPWTLLAVQAPPATPASAALPVDRPDARQAWQTPRPAVVPAPSAPYWQGTLLPTSDADIWLSTGFAKLERVLADVAAHAEPGDMPSNPQDDLGVELAYYRSVYGLGVRAGQDWPLAATRAHMGDARGYQVATGKGVLFLSALRDIVGAPAFDAAMRAYGRQHDGQPVSTRAFQAFLQTHTRQPLAPLFDWWMQTPGLPHLAVSGAESRAVGSGWETQVTLDVARLGPALAVPVTVETAAGDVTHTQVFDVAHPQIRIRTAQRPERVVLDKHGVTPRGNGSPFTILTLDDELEKALIVYGTADEEVGNHEAARVLQTALRRREHNVQPPIKADHEVTDDELRRHHLLLVGRPATNRVSQRLAGGLGVDFGAASFSVRGRRFSHPDSAVLAAGDNPLDARYSVVLVAGLGSLGTYQVVGKFSEEMLSYAPIVVLAHRRPVLELVPPLAELTVVPTLK